MSEMHANRLESLYLKFKDKKSIQVLSSKPSVIYLLASNVEAKKVDALAQGGKVFVGGIYKALPQLTINDVYELSVNPTKRKTSKAREDEDDDERDSERAKSAHRRMATLIEEINDWTQDLVRFQESNIEIKNKELVKKYVKETIQYLMKLEETLT